jgi:hypothetical protein
MKPIVGLNYKLIKISKYRIKTMIVKYFDTNYSNKAIYSAHEEELNYLDVYGKNFYLN